MQQVAYLIENHQQLSKSEPLEQKENAQNYSPDFDDFVDDFWQAMTELYGHLWISNYGVSASDRWMMMLSKLTVEQVKFGLSLCENTPEMPLPNMPKFKAMCKSMPDPQRFKSLPKPVVDKAKVQAAIAEANALLDGGVKALQEKRAKEKKVADLIWKQLHDADYIKQSEERKARMLAEWQKEMALKNAFLERRNDGH